VYPAGEEKREGAKPAGSTAEACPHSGQNRAPADSKALQCAHGRPSGVPHSSQNRERSGLS
jgi:hypothetical protein